jgi:hypothetical protein
MYVVLGQPRALGEVKYSGTSGNAHLWEETVKLGLLFID